MITEWIVLFLFLKFTCLSSIYIFIQFLKVNVDCIASVLQYIIACLTPSSLYLPLPKPCLASFHIPSTGNHKFVFCICESVSFLLY